LLIKHGKLVSMHLLILVVNKAGEYSADLFTYFDC
jgi:hypothetical protein